MASDTAQEFLKVAAAHLQTVAVCEACAVTTRDLAAEVARGSVPSPEDLRRTVAEAERILGELSAVRAELERVIGELSR